MSDSLSIKQVQKDLKETLVGACLDRISYAITSWELRFVKKSQPDYHLYASDIIVPDVDTWFSALV
ncbi:MAG: hypothetical protein K8F91_12205, partial [Candidatus Obscuribacterales bacterium]|nr:hypothetical protein [Candidatus Obscuribacterales bacterium]